MLRHKNLQDVLRIHTAMELPLENSEIVGTPFCVKEERLQGYKEKIRES